LGLVLVGELDAHLVERLEQPGDLLRVAGLVGQEVVDLIEGQEPAPLAQLEERLEALVQLVHPATSLTERRVRTRFSSSCPAVGSSVVGIQPGARSKPRGRWLRSRPSWPPGARAGGRAGPARRAWPAPGGAGPPTG